MPRTSTAAHESGAASKSCPACKSEARLVNRMAHPAHESRDSLMYECRACGQRFTETVKR
jgi:DNA-directed RNA polymerase subunit M/transcription elongation factor TFIIS